MRSYPYVPTMVQAITVLTVLKMMTKAQTSCGSGSLNGKVMYERLPNTQLQGFDDDIVRDTAPPFMVLEKCQDLCLRDRASNNIVRTCSSFDFQPGSRIATFNGGPDYEESTCYLTREQAMPEGLGNYILVPNSVHFTEVCITSNRPERECPNRRYVFERHPRKKLKLPSADLKEVPATNRSECEDKCLNEFSFVCRSATFDSGMRMCSLSRFTRRTHPELLEDSASSDYLENTCLNAERRCDGLAVFIKEENKRLGGPFEVDLFSNITLEDCQAMCVRAEKYFCRSIEFDEMTKQCTLSEEDSVSQKDDIGVSSSPTHHFYDFACLDSPRGSEYPDNSVTSHLFTGKKPDTAFQRYRNSRLGGEHHSEISGRSLSECLDECLRQPSFQCRSAVYSERYRTCRLSRYNQRDGMRIIYDADYDYYENLMLGTEGEGSGNTGRPGETGRPDDRDRFHGGDRNRPGSSDNRPPYGRPGDNRYPPKYPYDRNPYDRPDRPPTFNGEDNYYPGGDSNDRYPGGRPGDRYPIGPERYPEGDRDRYPGGDRDRYPGGDRDRYPGGDRDRYPGGDRDRYPGGIGDRDRYPGPIGDRDRYPGSSDRYPGSSDRYPGSADRYPYGTDERYGVRYRPPGLVGDTRYGDYDRYGPSDRYPSPSYSSRYPERDSGDRYANRYGDRDRDRYGDRERYGPGERYGGDRPLSGGDRYNGITRYPGGDRYRPRPNGVDPNIRPSVYDDRDKPGYSRPGLGYDDKTPYRPVYEDRDKPGYRPGGDRFGGNRYGGSRFNGQSYYGDDRDGGSRWFFRPDRPSRPPGRPFDDRPPPPLDGGLGGLGGIGGPGGGGHRRPISPGPDGPIYDSFGGAGPGRPYSTRCDEGDNFKQVGLRQRIRKDFVRRFLQATSLGECQRECVETRDFICRSFNFRDGPAPYETERENCELSDRDSRDMELTNPQYFENTGNFDFYERSNSRQGADGDCLDVTQVCNEDGMEFTLRTPEGFYGRIYTYGFYDRCFFRGNGGTLNVLRISGAQGYPECGTQRYGDTMTNIVVVQFSDFVQTGKDKRFNLTCLFRGPGEAVVSSGFIGAGSGSPIPIEYLPAENTLSSKVRLMILYQGRPTTTIAVGDPLTFRLEAQDGYNYVQDIFATNVVARDPYSGRSVQLIDRFGCPVDSFVFPELDRGRSSDSLEARFNAFKIPESNFLVFEATVRTCRDGCQPAYCQSGSGRSEPSFGRRRRRDVNGTMELEGSNNTLTIEEDESNEAGNETTVSFPETPEHKTVDETAEGELEKENEAPEYVREMIEVFETREELQQEARRAVPITETVCITNSEYQGLVTAILALAAILITISLIAGLAYRRYWTVMTKNRMADRNSSAASSRLSSSYPTTRSSGLSALSGISIFGGAATQKPFSGFGTIRNFPGVSHHMSGATNRGGPVIEDDLECSLPAPGGPFEDPSEPIYTDPSLFERSRSLRSIAVSQKQRHSSQDK